jgi:hypothetical protein
MAYSAFRVWFVVTMLIAVGVGAVAVPCIVEPRFGFKPLLGAGVAAVFAECILLAKLGVFESVLAWLSRIPYWLRIRRG